jgi:hypothetical protein
MFETKTAPRQIRIRPMLYSGRMVRAIREGRKTQTRRMLNPQPPTDDVTFGWYEPTITNRRGQEVVGSEIFGCYDNNGEWGLACPYGGPGDQLWVRESCYLRPERTNRMLREGADTWPPVMYRADMTDIDVEWCREHGWKPTPSIHMPRWASRLTLEIISVRAHRLHEITDDEIRAEGITDGDSIHWGSYRRAFIDLWDSINRKRCPWKSNPWVWAVEFRKVEL